MKNGLSGNDVASLTSGTEIAVIVAVAVSVVLAAGRLTRSTAVPSPIPNPGYKGWPRVLGHAMLPQRLPVAAWLQQRLNVLRAGLARFTSTVKATAASSRALATSTRSNMPAVNETCAPRLTAEAQWDRVSRTINRAVDAAALVRTSHSSAAEKLDAADYALERLMAELGSVMKLKTASAEVAEFPRAQRARTHQQGSARVAA